MIQFVQNGEYRTRKVVLKRFVNGVETSGDGFPIEESLLLSFGNEPAVTDQALSSMKSHEFTQRVDAFKAYLLAKYPFLQPTDFINTASGTDATTCVPGTGGGTGTIPITNQTEIDIYFDSSGSMNATLSPLLEMRNTLLKTVMLPFYGGDAALYDQRVRVISDGTERTFQMLNNKGQAFTRPKLIMVFQDEANSVYHNSSAIAPRTTSFNTDITALRTTISSLAPNTYRGVVFQVTRAVAEGVQFKALIQAVQTGNADYPQGYNFADRSEVSFTYDVANGQNAQYYMDLIVLKMRELGYRI